MSEEERLKELWKEERLFTGKNELEQIKDHKEKKQIIENLGRNIFVFVDKRDLARQFLRHQPLFYDKSKMWWIWDKEKYKWALVDETDVLNAVDYQSRTNTISSKDKGEIIEALKQEGRKYNPEPIKNTWVQFKDKIIDIETGETFTASPKYFITNPIPYALSEEDMQTPNMDRIFKEWVGKDYVSTLYEIISYCLLVDYPINRIFCFIGVGLNGKTKFLDLITKFVGVENCATTELDTLLLSRFEITRLHKKLVCQMGETNFNEMKKTSTLKKLSGGDLIGFEYKNKDLFHEKNYAKILISTNNLPTTDDKTIGFYRRWMIIDFPNTFDEKKDILNDIPDEEYNCLASKCVKILKNLLIKREFYNEGSIEERKDRFEAKSDFLQKFLDENIIEDLNSYVSKSDFYKKFVSWCKENRHRELAENTLGRKMKEKGISANRKYADWLYDGKGGQMNVWEGVKWKE
jgi:putative DNA primase/helicase|tara:strand:- start:1084 stop:2472 length:1389 start_codon:yes stop_codon:yes gene_type:complete